MELFKLTDITYNKEKPRSFDSAKNTQFGTETFRYPMDVGTTDKGHYVVFYVNEQIATNLAGKQASGKTPTIRSERTSAGESINAESINAGSVIRRVADAIDKLSDPRFEIDATRYLFKNFPDVAAAIISGSTEFKNAITRTADTITKEGFTRTVRRITDTFVLYMPDTIAYTFNQNYSDVNMGGGAFALASVAGGSVADMSKNLSNPSELGKIVGKNLTPFLAYGIQKVFGDQGSFALQNLTGTVINPQLELLYTSPSFRNYSFEFMFYPRDSAEAFEVMKIIRMFEFHQAPEIREGNSGFFLVPPSEFDIEFHYNGKINPNLPKYTTSVLTSMDVDYTPNGFSSYELMGEDYPSVGGTGMPVGIRLTLNFKEVDFRTKKTIKQSHLPIINR